MDFSKGSKIIKVDEELGLVFGWAIICSENGEEYYDLQDDHIPEDSMVKAALDFMENSRASKVNHDGDDQGSVVFAMPMTADVAKSFGVKTEKTGLMIAVRPSESMMEKFKSGDLTGFSIGGKRVKDEEVSDG